MSECQARPHFIHFIYGEPRNRTLAEIRVMTAPLILIAEYQARPQALRSQALNFFYHGPQPPQPPHESQSIAAA